MVSVSGGPEVAQIESNPDTQHAPRPQPVRARAFVLGVILIPANLLWLMRVEYLDYSNTPTPGAIFFNAIFALLCLMILNSLAVRFAPRVAFSRGEMLVVYVMIGVAHALAGLDLMQLLFTMVHYVVQGATAQNNWTELIWPHLPWHLVPAPGPAVSDLYTGNSSLYTPEHYLPWLSPILCWSAFILALVWTAMCLTSIFRRQWESERLTYPIAEIPLQLTEPRNPVFRNRLFWLAFCIAAGVRLWNLAHFMRPSVPLLPVQVTAFTLGNDMPWAAAGPIPLSFFPFALGICFFLPTQLTFSVVFFAWFNRFQEVFGAMMGYQEWMGPPWVFEQGAGGAIALAFAAIWLARKHIRQVFLHSMGRLKLDDSNEPMPYQTAFWGCVLGFGFMVVFVVSAGMRLPTALFVMSVIMLMVLATARLRAEVGLPTIDINMVGPEYMLRSAAGDLFWTRRELTAMALFFWVTRINRQLPMSVQVDGVRMAERSGLKTRHMTYAMLIAAVVGVAATWWIFLHTMYKLGYYNHPVPMSHAVYWNTLSWARLESWLTSPGSSEPGKVGGYMSGGVITLALSYLRTRYVWWPLHPAGYVAGSCFGVMRYWLPMLVAAVTKTMILRGGGLKAYRIAMPFFVGLVLGEFTAGMLISLLSFRIPLPMNSGIGGL